jgi:hypothetical protein
MHLKYLVMLTCSLLLTMIACDESIEESSTEESMAGVDNTAGVDAGEMMGGEMSAGVEMTMGGNNAGNDDPMGGNEAGMEPIGGEMIGGMESPPTQCKDSTVLSFQADTDGASLVGNLDESDNVSGSCGDLDAGADVVVEFIPEISGIYKFTVTADAFSPLIYALEDCNNGFTEIACKADSNEAGISTIIITATENIPVFIVVDSLSGGAGESFILTGESFEATPPSITSGLFKYNPANGGVGLVIEGSDLEDDVRSYKFNFLDGDGTLVIDFETSIDDPNFAEVVTWTQANGTFSYVLTGFFDPTIFIGVASVDLLFIDEVGLESDVLNVVITPAMIQARGDACDTIFTDCSELDACILNEANNNRICSEANPPTITTAEGFINTELGLIGVSILGNDPENNLAYVRILPLDESGEAINITNEDIARPVNQNFDWLVINEELNEFSGRSAVAAIRYDVCFEDASSNYEDCTMAGTDRIICEDQANELFNACFSALTSEIASIQVWVVDDTMKESEVQTISVSIAAQAESGDICDSANATAICPEDFYCFALESNTPYTCGIPQVECPDFWNSINLNESLNMDGTYSYEGNNATNDNYQAAASCGGGGPQSVFNFTAPQAGTWDFSAFKNGDMIDLLMFANQFCTIAQTELACNDDVDTQGGNYDPKIEVDLENNQTITIFVDSYNGQNPGVFSLVASRIGGFDPEENDPLYPACTSNEDCSDGQFCGIECWTGACGDAGEIEAMTLGQYCQPCNECAEGSDSITGDCDICE